MSSTTSVRPQLPEIALGLGRHEDDAAPVGADRGEGPDGVEGTWNHWWHVTFYVDTRGLTTRRMRSMRA